ncbi:hypothetical protein Tco_1432452, partial [Tanacetum coccineum]
SIPDALLTDEIKGASYFSGYLEHVAEYQRYLDEEHDKVEEEEAATEYPKATKVTKPKDQGERTQGPARPVVIREPDSRRLQPLPEVQGKGKEKVIEEQAAHDLLTLQTPKKKRPAYQFIFQRRTLMPTDAKLALTDNETESDNEVPKINTGDQDEG